MYGNRPNASKTFALQKRLAALMLTILLACMASLVGCAQGTDPANNNASAQNASLQQAEQGIQVNIAIMDANDSSVAILQTEESLPANSTVLNALEETGAKLVVEDGQYGKYISSIDGVAAEGNSGWVYTVNGEEVMESADTCVLNNGDAVEFSYITM